MVQDASALSLVSGASAETRASLRLLRRSSEGRNQAQEMAILQKAEKGGLTW